MLDNLYPFNSHFFAHPDGTRQHYLDEGAGAPLVMVHGNPTWSFYFRDAIKHFRATRRVIAPDHIGLGFSDKPQNYPYRLATHIENLTRLLGTVLAPEEKVSLLVHDWGGAVGMGWAVNNVDRVDKIIVMNTAAFLAPHIPLAIRAARLPVIGDLLVRGGNLFVRAANRTTTVKPLPREVQAGYLLPYNNWHNRIGTLRFAQDVPMNANHPSYATLREIEDKLTQLRDRPLLIQWGARDWCFHDYFYHEWERRFPGAEKTYYPDAGHYLLEDAGESVIPRMAAFLRGE